MFVKMDNVLKLLNEKNKEELNLNKEKEQDNYKISVEQSQDKQLEKKKGILEELFDDKLIKAEQSPFRTFPDDKQKPLITKSFVDLGKVIQQYRNGEIDERTVRVLHIIVKHQYITTKQIQKMYLLDYHLYIKTDILLKLLNRMMEKGLIAGGTIEGAMGKSNYRCYCVDYNGIRLYTAIESENVNWKRTDTIQKAYIIKRSLAKNQFLISCLKYYELVYELQPLLTWSNSDKEMAVRPCIQMKFNVKNSMDSIVFLVEVIRTYNGWEKDYIQKLVRYGQYLKSVEDTQSLKKYYIVVCAESGEQANSAIKLFYNLQMVQNVVEVQNMQIYYTCDILMLDGRYEGSLLSNLRTYQYIYGEQKWIEKRMEFTCETHDWRNLDFKIDRIEPVMSEKKKEENDIEYLDAGDVGERTRKQMLALQIYNAVIKQGHKFPELMVRMAQILKRAGIDYQEWGYAKLKFLFKDLSYFYCVHEVSSTQQTVTCTPAFIEIINKEKTEPVNVSNVQKTVFTESKLEKTIFYDYLMDRMKLNRDRSNVLKNDIFCYQKWDMTVKEIENMTHINDLSEVGWYNFISYVYSQAKDNNILLKNETETYMGFDIGLKSFNSENIYFIAKLNNSENPKWVLEGVATVSSYRLGDVLRDELGIL